MAIGYRMLGSVQETEDLVQDVWLRWHDELKDPHAAVLIPEAWLVTVTTRMAIDRLRAAKLRREAYPGLWLPEPLVEDLPDEVRTARSDGAGDHLLPLRKQVENLERRLIGKALLQHKTTREAAKALGLSQATLVQKMKRWEQG